MKTLVLSIISLFTVSLWSFANEDGIKARVPNHANNESIIYSSNTNVNDYSKREFSPEGIIMPRMGEYYEGAISYNNVSFPLYIYCDLEIEGYNLYAYIQGSSTSIDGYHHTMSHIATRNSECSNSRFDFIITCNYTYSNYTGFWKEYRHISFHVTFYPATRSCTFEILEDEEGRWEGEI